ncbi:hypothetical protein EV182_001567, partial [Spiromyces aspiralis]
MILNDKSVSRKHATIIFEECKSEDVIDPDRMYRVVLRDERSKFGVFINDHRLEPGSQANLESGDEIMFGQQNSIFGLRNPEIVLCVSGLRDAVGALPEALVGLAQKLGVKLVNQWGPRCTHLVATKLKVTPKVVNALVANCPIVSVEYLGRMANQQCCYFNIPRDGTLTDDEYQSHIETYLATHSFLPDPEGYLPPADHNNQIDTSLVRWDPQRERTTLFAGKRFVFASRQQWQRFDTVISGAGGDAIYLDIEAEVRKLRLMPSSAISRQFALKDAAKPLAQSFLELAASGSGNYIANGADDDSIQLCITVPSSSTLATASTTDERLDLELMGALLEEAAGELGLRVIRESEIGLAVLFISCDHYCNPSPTIRDFVAPRRNTMTCDNSNKSCDLSPISDVPPGKSLNAARRR